MCDVPSGHLRYGMSPLKKRTSVVNHHESSINGPLLIDGNGYNGWNQPKKMGIIWISSIKV